MRALAQTRTRTPTKHKPRARASRTPPPRPGAAQVLKEALSSAAINGRRFRPGAMTRDQLVGEYRRLLGLPAQLAEGVTTDIDRVTGVGDARRALCRACVRARVRA
jgi:hypothetical protein